jgi:V-type H+-transporting ATPase subunit a
VLWRATRGNLFIRQTDIPDPIKDPQTGEQVEKNVFIIFFQGDRLQAKIRKICESFGATIYPCPESEHERTELSGQVNGRLQDLEVVLARSHEHRKQVLSGVATHLQTWKAKVLKEKAIYHTMNMFNYDIGRKCLIAEGWCPHAATDDIQLALRRATV